MKKTVSIIVTILCILSIFGCSKSSGIMNYDSKKYVTLGQYREFTLESDYVQISNEELRAIVETELSDKEAYIEISDRKNVEYGDIVKLYLGEENLYYYVGSGVYSQQFDDDIINLSTGDTIQIAELSETAKIIGIFRYASYDDTEFVLNFYNCKTTDEFENFIRERAKNEIIFNSAYDSLCEKTIIKDIPKEIETNINADIENAKKQILSKYSSVEEYFEKTDITEEEFEQNINSFYREIMIFKAILDNENITISENEIDKYIFENKDIISDEYSKYDIYNLLAREKIRNILIENTTIK